MRQVSERRRASMIVLGCLVGLLTAPLGEVMAEPPLLDAFLKYRVRRHPEGPKPFSFGPVGFRTRLNGGFFPHTVRFPSGLLVPAGADGGGIADPETHLVEYRTARSTCCTFGTGDPSYFTASNACGEVHSFTLLPVSVLMPANGNAASPASAPAPGSHDLDRFACLRVRRPPPVPRGAQVTVSDRFGVDKRYDLLEVRELCLPADTRDGSSLRPSTILSGPLRGARFPIEPSTIGNPDRGLICYRARLAKRAIPQNAAGCGCDTTLAPSCDGPRITQAKARVPGDLHLASGFGRARVRVRPRESICLPADLIGGAHRTADP